MYTYTHAWCVVVTVCMDILGRRGESTRGSGHQFVCVCVLIHTCLLVYVFICVLRVYLYVILCMCVTPMFV